MHIRSVETTESDLIITRVSLDVAGRVDVCACPFYSAVIWIRSSALVIDTEKIPRPTDRPSKRCKHTRNSYTLFRRCFGPKCVGCGEGILPQDLVRKARDRVYHTQCFTCSMCSKKLETGEVLYLGSDTLLCKEDYLKTGNNQGKEKTKTNG